MSAPLAAFAADPPSADEIHDRDLDYAQKVSNEWDRRSLEAFLPKRTGDFILPWETISDQVFTGLGRAPLNARALPDGHRLLWGCRWGDCTEKAALVVSPGGKVEAAALVHAGCHLTAFPDRGTERWRVSNFTCTGNMTLTIFLHVEQTYRADFEQWAKAVSYQPFKVEIYWV